MNFWKFQMRRMRWMLGWVLGWGWAHRVVDRAARVALRRGSRPTRREHRGRQNAENVTRGTQQRAAARAGSRQRWRAPPRARASRGRVARRPCAPQCARCWPARERRRTAASRASPRSTCTAARWRTRTAKHDITFLERTYFCSDGIPAHRELLLNSIDPDVYKRIEAVSGRL